MTSNLRFMVRFLLLRWVLPLAATSVWATLSYVNMEHNCMALYPGAAYLGIPHLCQWEEAHPVCQLKH